MRLDKMTIKAQEALQAAHDLAEKRNHQELTPEHVLAALLGQEQGIVSALLRKMGVEPDAVRREVIRALDEQTQVQGAAAEIYVGRRLKDLMQDAQKRSEEFKDEYVSSEHLLLALAGGDHGAASRALKDAGVREADLLTALAEVRGTQRVTDREAGGQVPGAGQVHARSHRPCSQRQAGPRHRPRRGDPPFDAGAVAAHEEQSRADRRSRRRQDGGRRGDRAAHRGGRRSRVA